MRIRRLRCTLVAMLAVCAGSLAPQGALAQGFPGSHFHFPQKSGRMIYTHICQGCHMPNAEGAEGAGAYPPLAHNPRLASVTYMIAMVLNGFAAMPRFRNHLSAQQIANVINYVRTHFGNHYPDKLTAAAVRAVRSSPPKKK